MMTTDITNEQLHFRLTGDDGRCSKPCETCGGSGWEVTGSCPSSGMLEGEHCPDCTDGVIWNRERIAAACREFVIDVRRIGDSYLVHLNHTHLQFYMPLTTDNRFWAAGRLAWDNRHGADWQASLEAHVLGTECQCSTKQSATRTLDCETCNGTGRIGGYVEPAPDYRNDERALKAALRAGGYYFSVSWLPGENMFDATVWKSPYDGSKCPEEQSEIESEALFAATVAAVRGEA